MFLETATALMLGLSIGSFLNVVIYRLPLSIDTKDTTDTKTIKTIKTTLTLNNPKRSFCPLCYKTLSAFELIPLFSYLLQKGKCRHCNATISWHYPLVETITALISALIVFIFGATIQAGFYLLLAWFLIPLFVIDLKQQLLPDVLTLPLMWLGLIYQIQYGNLQDGVIGAISSYLFLWIVYWAFKLLRDKEGMGYGDFKLVAALGAWVGWQAMPLLLLVASVLSVVFFLLLRLLVLSRLLTLPIVIDEVKINATKSIWAILKSTIAREVKMHQFSSSVTLTSGKCYPTIKHVQSTSHVTSTLATSLKLGQGFEWSQSFAFGPFLIVGFVVVGVVGL